VWHSLELFTGSERLRTKRKKVPVSSLGPFAVGLSAAIREENRIDIEAQTAKRREEAAPTYSVASRKMLKAGILICDGEPP